LSGWVAPKSQADSERESIGRAGYLNDPTKYSTLRSALAVPIEGPSEAAAVLALYRAGQDAFTKDDLLILETIGSQLEPVIRGDAKGKAVGSAASAAKAGS